MDTFDCDLFVIGAGSAGVRAGRMAAARGVRVIIAEGGPLGGTCVNLGCIPKKLYSHAAHYGELFEESVGFGWSPGEPSFDWQTLKARRAVEIARLNTVYEGLLSSAGARLVRGWAQLADAHTVVVQDSSGTPRRFTARHIALATGGRPQAPVGPGAEDAVTSDDMFDLDPFPRRLLVVGGGYIACEFASIFAGLGSEVTLVHRGPRLLRGFDDEVAAFATAEMQKKGLTVRLNATLAQVRGLGAAQMVRLSDGATLEVDTVLHAVGRRACTAGLGLETLGIGLHADGTVPVDERFRTAVPSIHAIGDLVGHKALTPVALAEAMVLVDQLFGEGMRPPIDYDAVPTAVFTHPNIGTVGKTEARARKDHGDVRIFRAEFKALKHTLSGSTERTLLKMVVDGGTDRVLGVHMVGADAGEVIQGFAVAVQAGLTKAQIDRTVGIHPTVAEEFVTMREAVR